MKTIWSFDDGYHKARVTLRHKKDVSITKETRPDHLDWTDGDGNKIEKRDYVVITFPASKSVDWSKWTRGRQDDWHIGFKRSESNGMVELLFYDQFTFTWITSLLEDVGIAKVSHLSYPGRKEGYLFPVYADAHGFRQLSYNVVTLLIQAPLIIQSERKHRKEMEQWQIHREGSGNESTK